MTNNPNTPGAKHSPATWLAHIPKPALMLLVIALAVFGAFLVGRKAGAGKQDSKADKPDKAQNASDGKQDDSKQAGGDKGKNNAPPPGTVTLDPEGMKLSGLQIQQAGMGILPVPLLANGTILPGIGTQANVMPRLAGKVLKTLVNIGDNVQAGQALAMIASPELGTAQEAVHDATLRRNLAARSLARQREYYRLGTYGTTEVENARLAFEQTQGEVQTNKDQVKAAQQMVAQEEAKLRSQQAALDAGAGAADSGGKETGAGSQTSGS